MWKVIHHFKPSCCHNCDVVTNLVASHHTTAANHPWTTTPIIHCSTTHTVPSTIAPITQLSPITNQPWLSCHTCTSFTHPHISSTLPYTRCEVLFVPWLTFLSVIHPAIGYLCVWPWTARPWNSEPVLVTSTPAWYCLRLCSASDIPVVARWPLPVWFCLCLINLTASGSTRLRPVITDVFSRTHLKKCLQIDAI